MGFHKLNGMWTRKNKQFEGTQNSEDTRPTIEETPRASSPDPPQAPQTEQPSSSSSMVVTEDQLMRIVNSVSEDLKEYIYKS